MIIWRGIGCLAPVIGFVMLVIVTLVFETIFPDPKYIDGHPWTWLVLGFSAAVPTWFIGRYLNSRPGRMVIDKTTGQEIELRRKHDLFFVPMEYWGVLFAIIAVIATIVGYLT